MLDWLNGIIVEGQSLLRLAVILVAIYAVIATYARTRALVPVLSAVLVAGVAIWAVSPAGLAQLENWIGSDAAGTAEGVAIVPALAVRARKTGIWDPGRIPDGSSTGQVI